MNEKKIEVFYRNIYYVKVFSIFVSVVSIIAFLFWACFPLINTIYTYTDGKGGAIDIKYQASWAFIFLMSLNLFLPFLLLWVIESPKNTSRSDFYYMIILMLVKCSQIQLLRKTVH